MAFEHNVAVDDGHHRLPRLQVLAVEYGTRRTGGAADHVRSLHHLARVRGAGHRDPQFVAESRAEILPVRAGGAVHLHALQGKGGRQRPGVQLRLVPRAEEAGDAGVRPGQEADRRAAGGTHPQRRDAAVHDDAQKLGGLQAVDEELAPVAPGRVLELHPAGFVVLFLGEPGVQPYRRHAVLGQRSGVDVGEVVRLRVGGRTGVAQPRRVDSVPPPELPEHILHQVDALTHGEQVLAFLFVDDHHHESRSFVFSSVRSCAASIWRSTAKPPNPSFPRKRESRWGGAGQARRRAPLNPWIPAFAGMTEWASRRSFSDQSTTEQMGGPCPSGSRSANWRPEAVKWRIEAGVTTRDSPVTCLMWRGRIK